MLHTFRGFPSSDPELPESIAPGAAARAEAVVTFDAIYDALAEPATRHFAEVALGEAPTARAGTPPRQLSGWRARNSRAALPNSPGFCTAT